LDTAHRKIGAAKVSPSIRQVACLVISRENDKFSLADPQLSNIGIQINHYLPEIKT
jgi:hypothetical protein